MTDMIRATIVVDQHHHLVKCYNMVNSDETIKIIRIKNKLDSDLKNVSINFIYDDMIIGEI